MNENEIQTQLKEIYLPLWSDGSLSSDLWASMPDGVNREAVREAYLEVAQRLTEYEGDEETLRNYLGEIADSCIPIYTAEKWAEFIAYRLWNSNEIEQEAGDLVQLHGELEEIQEAILNAMLYSLYYFAGSRLIDFVTGELLRARVAGELS